MYYRKLVKTPILTAIPLGYIPSYRIQVSHLVRFPNSTSILQHFLNQLYCFYSKGISIFFYITKAFLCCIIKRAFLYVGSISFGVVNSLVILTFSFLPIDIDSFISISIIVFCYLSVKSIWFGYRIYSLQSIILTINISWVLFVWSLLFFIIEVNLR